MHQPAAQLGRAAAVLPAQGQRRAAPATRSALIDRARGDRRARRRRGLVDARRRGRARRDGADSAEHYAKSNDILDVWFDSGSTFCHVLRGSHPGTTTSATTTAGPEADLYLEGHDQHRGWFHSSLLIACAIEGHAPYRGLLTHGFTVDGSGRKMSKSWATSSSLQRVTSQARRRDHPPVVRRRPTTRATWRSTTRSSPASSTRYRRIRNTLRFLLANTSDFDAGARRGAARRAARDRPLGAGAHGRAAGRDRRRSTPRDVFAAATTSVYEFHPVVAKLQVFCSEDLGAFYLDVLKDRLYTTAPGSHGAALARRPRSGTSPTRCCAGWRRSSASPPRRRGRCSAGRTPRFRRSSPRPTARPAPGPTPRCWRTWARIRELSRRRQQGDRGAARRRRARLVAAGRADDHAPRPTTTGAARVAGRRPAASSSSPRAAALSSRRGAARAEVAPAAATPNASAAGTAAPTSASTRAHPTLCGRCTPTCSAPAKRAGSA